VESRHAAINKTLRRLVEDQRAQRRTVLEEPRELSANGAFVCEAQEEDPG
jgi:hypothetical protein